MIPLMELRGIAVSPMDDATITVVAVTDTTRPYSDDPSRSTIRVSWLSVVGRRFAVLVVSWADATVEKLRTKRAAQHMA